MEKPRVLVSLPLEAQRQNICPEAREKLESFARVSWNAENRAWSEEEKSERLKGMDGIILGWGDTGLTEANIKAADKLKIIGVIGSSVRHVSPYAAIDRGITITNTAKAIGDSVAEFSLALILSSLRDIPAWDKCLKSGGWHEAGVDPIGWDLSHKTVGIIGVGTIGKRMVELLKPFEAKILAYDPYLPKEVAEGLGIELVSLEELLSKSKVITIHAGMTEETYHMIGKRQLALIQDGAVVVNTARGNIFDEEALLEELKKKRFKAALDVFSREPLPKESQLRQLDNVILTPHKAGLTYDTLRRIGWAVVEDFELFFSGKEPKNKLTREQIARMT